jgi:hypothetical protein
MTSAVSRLKPLQFGAFDRPNPRRLGKRQAVTVALGLLCKDGIVLCADSQETLTFSKFNRPKVFELNTSNPVVKVVLAGAGEAVFLDALKDKLETCVGLAGFDLDVVQSEMEATIAGYCERIWRIYGDHRDRPEAQLLIGIRAVSHLALLHCDGPKVRRVLDYESIGFGGDFSAYHLKRLFNPYMSVGEACPLAVHVLEVVKNNVDYCGGPSQVYVLPISGEVQHKEPYYLHAANLAFTKTSHFADQLLSKLGSLVTEDLDTGDGMDFFEGVWPWMETFIAESERQMDLFIEHTRKELEQAAKERAESSPVDTDAISRALARMLGGVKTKKKKPKLKYMEPRLVRPRLMKVKGSKASKK